MATATDAAKWFCGQPVVAEGISIDVPTYSLVSPTTNDSLADVADVGPTNVASIVDAAELAFNAWQCTNPHERASALLRWHSAILENLESLAVLVSLEMGKPIAESRGEVRAAAENVAWAAAEAPRIWGSVIPSSQANKHAYTLRQPVGVAYGITPWNFPVAMVTRKVAPALATGCSFLLKPSEYTPLSAFALARLWVETSGAPSGTFQVISTLQPSALTDAVLAHTAVRKVTFTGSTQVGRRLYEKAAAGLRRVSLELGGHAPFIVYADADVNAAVEGVLATKFRNGGQTCISTNRAYIHEQIFDTFTERLLDRVSSLRVGHPLEEDVSVGPLINREAVDKALHHIRDAISKGASVVAGGTSQGLRVAPTVLTNVHDQMRVMNEETFGPVLPLARFNDSSGVVQIANGTPHGLAAYIWTRDLQTAHAAASQLSFGLIGINSLSTVETQAPFGGLKDSGIGYENGRWGIEAYLETKYVSASYGE